jgi:hypothetical protein
VVEISRAIHSPYIERREFANVRHGGNGLHGVNTVRRQILVDGEPTEKKRLDAMP